MSKIKLFFSVLIASAAIVACTTDKGDVAPPRERSVQYKSDLDSIEKYLQNHYIVTSTLPNGEIDIELDSITDPDTQVSIWDNTIYPLQFKEVYNDVRKTQKADGASDDKVLYKLYYLIINPGGGQKPTTVDSTFTSYKGWTLKDRVFDVRDTPLWSTYPASAGQVALISGYRQFVNELHTATSSSVGEDGTVTFANSGFGVVFVPSGLGYFEKQVASIGAYTPMVFKIRLQSLRYRDHDRDGVLSKDEELDMNHDPYSDDTDGDNIPDFLDIDDDGDGFSTLFEVNNPADCYNGTVPVYLDKNCHPPKKTN